MNLLGEFIDKALHWGGPVAKPRLSKERALAIAQGEAARRGWPWQEPVHISFLNPRPFSAKEITWVMVTNAEGPGGRADIRIRDASGEVVSSSYKQ